MSFNVLLLHISYYFYFCLFCCYTTLLLPTSTLFPYTTLFRSWPRNSQRPSAIRRRPASAPPGGSTSSASTRTTTTGSSRSEEHSLNSSHVAISYAVFCLKKKKKIEKN